MLEEGSSGAYTLVVSSGWSTYTYHLTVISNDQFEVSGVSGYDGKIIVRRG
jgi:hypothetical protein